MKTLAQGQRGVLRNQLMAWAKSPLGRGDDLPLSKLAAHGKSILTECDADGGERRPYRPLTQYQLVARKLITQVTQDAHVALTGIASCRLI